INKIDVAFLINLPMLIGLPHFNIFIFNIFFSTIMWVLVLNTATKKSAPLIGRRLIVILAALIF
ncbi:MAG: hypothetical protein IKP66_07330, partial [Lachnospiraceae bacterium]|nr:hypothetical protein [Lachnospiraceae bacterium]